MPCSPYLHWSVNNSITLLLESVPSFVVALVSKFSFIHHIVSLQSHCKPLRISVWFKDFTEKIMKLKALPWIHFISLYLNVHLTTVHKIYPRRKRNAKKKCSLRTVTAKCAVIIILWLFHNLKKNLFSFRAWDLLGFFSPFYDRRFRLCSSFLAKRFHTMAVVIASCLFFFYIQFLYESFVFAFYIRFYFDNWFFFYVRHKNNPMNDGRKREKKLCMNA